MIGGAGALAATRPGLLAPDPASAQTTLPPTPFKITRFQATLPLSPVLREYTLDPGPGHVYHGIAPEFEPSHPCHAADWNDAGLCTYKLVAEQRIAQIIPGVNTPVFTYRDANEPEGSGTVPGPTILTRFNVPIVVRQQNLLTRARTYVHHDIEASIHHHGGHNPAHADGHPAFYTLPDRERDYYYPNIVPKRRKVNGVLDFDRCATPSTMWYHDHSMDITGFTVSRGLAGYYLLVDDIEQGLIDRNVLPDVWQLETGDPENCYDIPLMFTDQRFNADGTLHYDFLNHDGRLGDVFTVNGAVQPTFCVQRRKYRLRFCNGSNARYYQLRMSTPRYFLQIGKDSWLFPNGIEVRDVVICPGERADVIVDFRDAPDAVYLQNIMQQTSGRRPDGPDPNRPTPLIKFVVDGAVDNDITIDKYTPLREHVPITSADIVKTRVFEFERGNGAWQINGRFYNPRRADAVPQPDDDGQKAERWILKNGSGGWFHPIHIHLEHMEVQKINGRNPSEPQRCKSDIVNLADNTTAEVFIRLRTFTGPFVFHCHIVEHEDMRMMAQQDPRKAGDPCPLDGVSEIDPAVSGVPLTCEELEKTLYFEAAGDVDRLEGRGVGVPCDDFERGS